MAQTWRVSSQISSMYDNHRNAVYSSRKLPHPGAVCWITTNCGLMYILANSNPRRSLLPSLAPQKLECTPTRRVCSIACCLRSLGVRLCLSSIEETLRRSDSRRLLLSPSGEVQVELLARKNKQREDSVCRHLIALHLAQALTAPLGKSVGSAGP